MIMLKSTDFTTYLNRAVCFFHMFDRLFFIMIMNRLHCEGRMLKCVLPQPLSSFGSSTVIVWLVNPVAQEVHILSSYC